MAVWQFAPVIAILVQFPSVVSSRQKCLGGFDIYFILDKSGSVTPSHFHGQTVDFVENTVNNFAGTGVRVSFITFSEISLTETVLRLTGDRAKINKGLAELRKVNTGGGTRLAKALEMANDQIKELGGTQASIIIIITDGRIVDIIPATDLTKKARQAGAAVYVIGIAAFVRNDLERLANKPPQYFVFTEPNYKLLKNLTDDIANKSCVELTSVNPKQACLGENSTVTLIGRGFIKFSVAVWCGFSLNATYRQATRALAVEDNRLICPVPALKDTNSSFMLQVSMNNGTTFVSSNVNITAKNCIQPTEPIARVELTSVDPKEVCLGAADRRCYDWNLVCSCGGGSAQRQNVCDTPSNDTIPDRYLPIGLVTEGKKSQSPYFVEHCNISVLCMGKARAPRWLKRKAKRCKKDVKRRCFDWNLVCSHGGGGGAQRHNDCDTLPNDTFPDRYLPIGLVTEGNQSHSPYFVEHCNVSVLCMGKAIAPRWPKSKAKPCKKGIFLVLPKDNFPF